MIQRIAQLCGVGGGGRFGGRGAAGRGRAKFDRLQRHDDRIRLVILRRTGRGVHAHAGIRPPARILPAKPAAPRAGNFLVSGITCVSNPSLVTVTVMSALRFATTTQGVTQDVGLSSPDSSAMAPGVLEMEMFSVVPRVTDAQPTHGSAIAAANANLIMWINPLPGEFLTQSLGESKGPHDFSEELVSGMG